MAKKPNPKKLTDYNLKSIWFSEAEKERFKLDSKEEEYDLESALQHLCDSYTKVSISVDQNTSNCVVSVTPKNTKLACFGDVYMFRHADLVKAVTIACWYYSEVLDHGNLPQEEESDTDW